jgi:hypothetical protein
VNDEGTYLIYSCAGSPVHCRIIKFTIDRTPPVLALHPLNAHAGVIHTMAFRPTAASSGIVLDRPGRLRLDALDTLSGVKSVEYRLDGSDWTPYSDDVSFGRTLVVPAAGTHTVSIRATDLARNVSEVDDLTFEVVDTTPTPSPSATPSPAPTATPTRQPTATPTSTPAPTAAPTPTPPSFLVANALTPNPSDIPPNLPFCGIGGPAVFTVTGQISDSGGAGTATYQWLHDGAVVSTNSLAFSQPATMLVTDTVSVPLPPGAVSGMLTVQLRVITAPGSASTVLTLVCQQD